MLKRLIVPVLALLLVSSLAACSTAPPAPTDEPEPDATPPITETSLAPGLYDIEGGKAQAIGTLVWVDLEGGFWAVADSSAAGQGANVAVIANGAELEATLRPLVGEHVSVIGERFEGASIRMAGPEIIAETVEALSPPTGAAE